MRGNTTGVLRVPDENVYRKRVVYLYGERELCVSNTYFKLGEYVQYIAASKGRGLISAKSIIDLL